MGLKHLLNKLGLFTVDSESFRQSEEGLSTVVHKLKQKDETLKQRISLETDEEELELLGQELDIVHFQTRKGMQLLARMRSCGEESPP